jgi:DNA repair exonuclease SbcCD nuclease subunit
MVRILHCSDVHLERRFTGPTITVAEAARRREELRVALQRIVGLAIESQVDALTIAGDLYEHEYATDETGAFLATQFRRLAPIPVLVAPGNHDPYVAGSLYQRVKWPENVTVFGSDGWRPVRIADEVLVWGIGHDGPAMRRDVLRELRLNRSDMAVLLFHGADISRPVRDDASQGPFRPVDVKRTGAAFALLGHEHTWRLASTFAYPGSPEPLGFFTEGVHYAALAKIDSRSVVAEPIEVSRVAYQTVCIDVSTFTSAVSLRRALEALTARIDPATIVRIVLAGRRAPDLQLECEGLTLALAGRLRYAEVVDETRVAATPADISVTASAGPGLSTSRSVPSFSPAHRRLTCADAKACTSLGQMAAS